MLSGFGFVPSQDFSQWTWDGIGGFTKRAWSLVVPPDIDWIVPSLCVEGVGVSYKPGERMRQYMDFGQVWEGAPSITYKWQTLDVADVELIRQGYETALATTRSRVWFMFYSQEFGAWWQESGIINPPTQENFTGEMSLGFSVTFSRIGFHANIACDSVTHPYVPTGLDFSNNGYKL